LRPAAGVTRGLHRFGQGQEQKPYHVGDGGVVVGRNPARLAVELGFDGYGDVSDGTHGQALLRAQEFRSIGSVHHRRVIICKTGFGAPGFIGRTWTTRQTTEKKETQGLKPNIFMLN
jgi:hypothetical protein